MDLAEVVGQLAELRRFPVEELGGEAPQIALLDGGAMVGHLAFELRDAETGRQPDASSVPILRSFSARYPDSLVPGSLDAWALVRLPDGREYPVLDSTWTAELSSRLPRPLVLQRRGAGTPPTLSLLSRPTLRFAERAYGRPLDAALLRATLIVDLPEGKPFAEDGWVGRRLRIGDSLLSVDGPATGAVVAVGIPDAGDLDMLRGLLHVRTTLGVETRVCSGTRLRTGDSVLLVD
jgi:uncharacterized protein YcbX